MITDQITRPTLIVDLAKVERNLDRMIQRAAKHQVKLVPHFKTHQSRQIGELFKQKGIEAITVSSVKMAEYFVANGWKDITIAFPINVLEVKALNAMMSQGVQLSILINHLESVAQLESGLEVELNVFIEIDAGYGRSGIPFHDESRISAVAQALRESKYQNLVGLYSHPGDSYHCDSVSEIQSLWAGAKEKMLDLKESISSDGKELIIRMGDTPGCSVVEDFSGVDEIGPGNFIFYDLVMNYLGVCNESDIAVVVAAPVVAKNEERLEVVVHGGAVHLSKDHLFNANEDKFFGEVVVFTDQGWSPIIKDVLVKSVSQEHGILKVSQEVFDQIRLGDVLGILPIHSCLTANLMKSYLSLEGEELEHLEKVF